MSIKLFTTETCELLKAMDVQERRQKLAGVMTAFFRGETNKVPAIAIAQAAGVDQELVEKVLSAAGMKGLTGPSDAVNGMNTGGDVIAGVFRPADDPLLNYGFEELFDLVDMRNSMQTSFDILDVQNMITFEEVKSGQRMKKYGVTDSKATVEKMIIAAAIGILDDWINYYKYWNLNQAAVEARAKYHSKMAADHYALIVAGSQAQAHDTDDITTINNACASILSGCAAKGYNITGNEVFELRANINLKQRVEKAFSLTFNSPNTDKNQLVHTVNRKYTTGLAADGFYVVLPGRKIKRGVWSDLSAETDRDILMRGTDVAYSGEYNAGVGEVQQLRKCALS